ncbi:MAG: aspartyl protease family protein [Sediminibacterium sp.]
MNTFRNQQYHVEMKPLAVFPFKELSGGVILVKATVNKHIDSLNFLFDTGNTGFSIDSSTATQLGLNVVASEKTIKGIAGIKKALFSYGHEIQFPGLTTKNIDLHVNDYSIFEQVYGLKIDGIVGFSFFDKYVVKIDYDQHLIYCYAPGGISYPSSGQFLNTKLYKFPINMIQLKDQALVDSKSIFDIGAGLNYLVSNKLVDDVQLFSPKKKFYPTQVEGLGGKKIIDITVVKKVSIGKYHFKNVPTHVFDDAFDVLNYPNLGGLIGSDLLRKFNIILNYPEEKIHITPNSNFNHHFDYHYSGISFYLIDGLVTIVDIVPNSPGAVYGFRVDDVVLSIDNKIVLNLQTLKDNFELSQSRHVIGILRNNQLIEMPIRLKNIKKQN